ncbi:hypothetical protein [Streptomyces sp. DSM 40750]|nr:hypothetical protein [Streptomyces sp. DSM 40750]UUU26856.1 hypothetical protein JIX55_45245 [Streptomyces sp. DSM 40750]
MTATAAKAAKTAISGGTGRYGSAHGENYITLNCPRTHAELDVDE